MNGKGASPAVAGTPPKVRFQEVWRTTVGPLKLAAATGGRTGGVVLGADGSLSWVDHRGKILWRTPLGGTNRSVSVAETQEVLVIQDGGTAMLLDPMGQMLWKKRAFPTLGGMVSGSGQQFAAVTRDPTVILADRASRPKWTYRNLVKPPAALALTPDGECVAFSAQDERGEGIAVVGKDGKPVATFMGLDPVIDLAMTADGTHLYALDRTGGVFCLEVAAGAAAWRARAAAVYTGLSHADETGQTLLFARTGRLCLLDGHGTPLWEQDLSGTLLTARLSHDGQTIWVATAEGAVIGLQSEAARDLTRKEFTEAPAPPPAPPGRAFQKRWLVDLPRAAAGDTAQARLWTGPDQVEYALLWDGRDSLACLNDLGEEIWRARVAGGPVHGLAVAPEADLAVALTGQGILGLHLDGSEAFRALGAFQAVHVFGNGSFLLLGPEGQVSFCATPNQTAHPLPLPGAIRGLVGHARQAALLGEGGVHLVDQAGSLVATVPGSGPQAVLGLLPGGTGWSLGSEGGTIAFFGWTGEVLYRHALGGPAPTGAVFLPAEDVVFLALAEKPELLLVQNRLQKRMRLPLPGLPRLLAAHGEGVVVATPLDDLLLVDNAGVLAVRYSFPDRLLGLFPSPEGTDFYVLAEGGFGRYTVSGPPTAAGPGTEDDPAG
ncbi:MAG: PQQ-binding-like beta-propeller repeat protein [Candidatus Riflebacteria bacterium]|nr:PQQ-binding-like beta-propeller repeat protein [Candidatus Riflebacteria bacterium]